MAAVGDVVGQEPAVRTVSLFKWTWRSYARTALVPLLAVEILLIAAYFITNSMTKDANIATVRVTAAESMEAVARLNAGMVAERLAAVAAETEVLQRQTARILAGPLPVNEEEAARFAFDPDGVVYYTPSDNGAGAGFYSGAVPVDEAMQRKAAALSALDPILMDIQQSSPLVVQAYFNTWDSYNRIYPFFDTYEQYAPRLDIPSFNFYYEADRAHNPSGGVVWTDAYVDPAGQGWMTSAIAPVYRGDFLEGVVGVDITLDTIVERMLDITTPWGGFAVLIGRDGTILAMPPAAEEALGLREVAQHTYVEAINSNTFKSEDYSIAKVPDLSHLPIMKDSGSGDALLSGAPHLVSWNTVEGPEWHLAVFVPEVQLYAAAEEVGDRFDRIGYGIVAALVLFYLIFFSILYGIARREAARLAEPMAALATAAGRIADGEFRPRLPASDLTEVTALNGALAAMGEQLGDKTARLIAASRSLEESDAFRRALIENLPVPVVFFGSTPDVVIAHNSAYDALVAEHGHEAVRDALAPLVDRMDADGVVHVSLGSPARRFTGRCTHLVHGGHSGVLVAMLDVTVQEEAKARIAEARDRALEAARLKSEFLAKVTHELRTPLNGIIGLSDLADGETDAGRVRDDVRSIGRSARSLLALVEDLLDLSAIETGQLTLDSAWFKPAAMVEDVLNGFRMQARGKGLTLEAGTAALAATSLHGPGDRIRQILVNLVGNAVKFTEEGRVRVAIDLVGTPADRMLEVTVEDSGVGIAPERLEEIFEPFRQADNTLTRRYGGVGLGLTISRDLATRMGGTLTAESVPGEGTRLRLTVPVTLPDSAVLKAPSGRPVCLVAGFDGVNEALVRAIMTARGASPQPVRDAAAAVESLQRGEASCVCLRVRGEADLEAVRALVAVGPQVVVSAVTDPDADGRVTATLRRLGVVTTDQPLTAAKIGGLLDRMATMKAA